MSFRRFFRIRPCNICQVHFFHHFPDDIIYPEKQKTAKRPNNLKGSINMKKIIAVILTLCILLASAACLAEEAVTVSFDAEAYSVAIGKAITLKAVISPRKNLKLEWSSSDESIATVNNRGAVKGIAEGEAEITVKAADDSSISTTCKVAVVQPVKKISFAEKKLDLPAQLTYRLAAKVEPENATNKALTFTSSNEKVATVDETGLITAVAKGNAKITVAAEDGSKVKAAINVKVDEYDLVFTENKPQKTIYYYRSGQFTVRGSVKTGCVSIPDITTTMMAMVVGGPASEEFEVTPVKPGTDVITVKAGRTKTVITAYVSPECFPEEEEKTEP